MGWEPLGPQMRRLYTLPRSQSGKPCRAKRDIPSRASETRGDAMAGRGTGHNRLTKVDPSVLELSSYPREASEACG